jgi:DnaJ-like protein
MITILVGLAALALMLWGLGVFTKADPKGLALGARKAGGVAALVGAAFLLFRGNVSFALPLGITGLGLLGWIPWQAALGQRTQRSAGQVSRVRSPFLEMELDHDTGAMSGKVTAGPRAGTVLDTLDQPALLAMLTEVDEESRALLAAYLDRRHPGWRESGDDSAHTRDVRRPSGKMTEEEAYQILGLAPGATADEIGRAHRTLMKKLHPDQGGSTYLAARVNEAKDVLLRRHR